MTKGITKKIFISSLIGAVAILCVFYVLSTITSNAKLNAHTQANKRIPRGVWVTCFSSKKVLYSKQAVRDLVAFCVKSGIDEIYLQIYRSGEAYYDSKFVGREKYNEIVKTTGGDPIDYLLQEARKSNISVHAWVNILSLAQNKKAPIVKKFGTGVYTHDQNGRVSIRTEGADGSDKFYLRDDQIFLEPGDERVVEWTLSVIREIIARYPSFKGIHLDYVRYPYTVPLMPDSRFVNFGVAYGYGEQNIARFKKKTGFNPVEDDMYKSDLHLVWDNWKREQVTNVIEEVSAVVRNSAKDWKISCAVVPGQERAYAIAFQDWPLWLEKGLIDYVVLMNYSKDKRLVNLATQSSLAYRSQGKVYVGIGIFLYKTAADVVGLHDELLRLKPDGIAFFSYDDLLNLGVSLKK